MVMKNWIKNAIEEEKITISTTFVKIGPCPNDSKLDHLTTRTIQF